MPGQNLKRLIRRKVPTAIWNSNRSRTPAWLLSMILHTIILLTLAVLWTSQPKGTGAERGGPIGIAVVVDNAGDQAYFLSGTSDASDQSSEGSDDAQQALAALPAGDGSKQSESDDLGGLLPTTDASGSGLAAGDLGLGGGNSQLSSDGSGRSKAKTTVFGIEGEGSRFLYVFDRSASMNGYEAKPLRRAKEELINSLRSLGPAHDFQIVFYNDHPLPYGGLSRPKLLSGDERQKESAIRFVKEISGDGGTNHVDALTMALAMTPDVIFFLTDADDNPGGQRIQRITDRAQQVGATIHCIQFGAGNRTFASNWIENLASSTQGQYRYVDVSKL